jgi:hypothetical protein
LGNKIDLPDIVKILVLMSLVVYFFFSEFPRSTYSVLLFYWTLYGVLGVINNFQEYKQRKRRSEKWV